MNRWIVVGLPVAGFAAVMVWLNAHAVSECGREGRLAESGRAAAGTVVRKDHTIAKIERYVVGARYEVGGERHEREWDVSYAAFEALEVGGPVEVTFLPGDPETATIAGDLGGGNAGVYAVVADALAVGTLVWLGRATWKRRRAETPGAPA